MEPTGLPWRPQAEVAELADAPDSKSGSLRGVWVRFPPSALQGSLRRVAANVEPREAKTPRRGRGAGRPRRCPRALRVQPPPPARRHPRLLDGGVRHDRG